MAFNGEWLQTVATLAVGSALAWGGTSFERRAQRREQNRALRRDKAEQIFAALAALEAGAHQMVISAMSIALGTGEVERSVAVDTSAVASLIDLYFPAARPALDELNSELNAQGDRYAAAVTAAFKKNDPAAMRSAALAAANERHATMRAGCEKLRLAVRASIAPLVR